MDGRGSLPRQVPSVLVIVAALILGLAAPPAPVAAEARALASMPPGASLDDICGRGGHTADGIACRKCCIGIWTAPPAPRQPARHVREIALAPGSFERDRQASRLFVWMPGVRAPPTG